MNPKVFITGPGRSGTTFLVQLLTRLGLDTGFEPYNEGYIESWRAGCEAGPDAEIFVKGHDFIRKAFSDSPRIIKGPVWAYLLKYFVINEVIEIERVVMPLRDLTLGARSRLSVELDFMLDKNFIGLKMEGQHKGEHQENILAMLVGKVVEACYIYDIPLTMMRFPEIVTDEDYCYRKVCEIEHIDRKEFSRVWKGLANPEQIQFNSRVIKV